MVDESLAQKIGELHGLVQAATAERIGLMQKLSSMEAFLSKVDVLNTNLDHMRQDYHDRFNRIFVEYGKMVAQISATDMRVSAIEQDDKIALATAKQKGSMQTAVGRGLWTLFVSFVGGIATLIVQYLAKH